MSELSGDRKWPRAIPRWTLQQWLTGFLLVVIAGFEWQRTDAQAKAHRERFEQSLTMARIEEKVDWLLLTQQPTASALKLRPSPASASLAKSR